MKKLTNDELRIIGYFGISANNFLYGIWPDGKPTIENVIQFCTENGINEVRDEASAEKIWGDIVAKLTDLEDDQSAEDLAIFLLIQRFTPAQLEELTGAEVEDFLKTWKNSAFEHCDGWGEYYLKEALMVTAGQMVEDTKSDTIKYIQLV